MQHTSKNLRPVLVVLGMLGIAALACGPSNTSAPSETFDRGVTNTPRTPGQSTPDPTATPAVEPTDPDGEAGSAIGVEYEVPDEGRNHVEMGIEADYEHFPPSSGLHWPRWVEEPGFYSEQIPPEAWVHNLEHGWVVVPYNCPEACPELEDQLFGLFDAVPESTYGYPKLLVFPNDQLPFRIVALAWGWELDLNEFDAQALLNFYNRHVDDGPEDAP
ncbi:MAG: DUF3105 domain-containing protein [Anaerolineales bacterium]